MKTTRVSGKTNLKKVLSELESMERKVGWVERKMYPDSDFTTAGVAAIAEEGSPKNNIPPRPIMFPTIRKRMGFWKSIVSHEMKKLVAGRQTVKGIFNILGNVIAGDFRERISTILNPPLKRATILNRMHKINKGRKNKLREDQLTTTFAKPLVFTKQLLNSCTYEIVDKRK